MFGASSSVPGKLQVLLPLAVLPLVLGGCDWRPIDAQTGLTLVFMLGAAAGVLLLARARALRSVLVLALAIPLALSGCAQYSACVKQKTSATFKTLTASIVETQVIGLIDLGISEQWIQLGLTAAEDACADTDCKALVVCVAVAWSEAHPISSATAIAQARVRASQDGISAYLVKKPSAWRTNCGMRLVAARQ
jgi:hypothetical protein